MKKKAIEKIPYLKLPGVKKGKQVKYAALTAVENIRKEPHLFVEVYRNRRECKEIPVVRIAITEKDFGTYFPESGEWSRGRIARNTWSTYGLIWWENDEQIRKIVNLMATENVLYSSEDLKRIQEFLKDITVWNEKEWWEYIDRKQQDITRKENAESLSRRLERRRQALKEREAQTPELPEQRILKYADDVFFQNQHYLYYKKHGSRVAVACSKCGGVTNARWKPGMSYESQFERMIEEPKMKSYGTCPMCQARGMYIPQGKVKSFDRRSIYLFLGQRYKKDGMVFRYIAVEKEWQLELACEEKEEKMCGAHEKMTGVEIGRAYFERGKKVQTDYHKHSQPVYSNQ